MSNVGRPTVITDEVVVKLEEMFRIDATCGEACTHAGISYDAYNERMNKDPIFRQRMESAQAFPFLVAKKTIIKAINEGNGELALKVLKSRQREIYYEKNKMEGTLNVSQLTDAELDRRIETAAAAIGQGGISGLIGGEGQTKEGESA